MIVILLQQQQQTLTITLFPLSHISAEVIEVYITKLINEIKMDSVPSEIALSLQPTLGMCALFSRRNFKYIWHAIFIMESLFSALDRRVLFLQVSAKIYFAYSSK